LWAVQRAFTGEPDDVNRATPDIGAREFLTVAPLLGLSLFLGFYPKPVLDRFEPTVQALVQHVKDNSNLKVPGVSDTGPAGARLAACDVHPGAGGFAALTENQVACMCTVGENIEGYAPAGAQQRCPGGNK